MVLAYNFTFSVSIKLYALIHHKRQKNIVELKLGKKSLYAFFMTRVLLSAPYPSSSPNINLS